MTDPLAGSTQMTAFIEAMRIETPAVQWLREAGLVMAANRDKWAAEDVAIENEGENV